MNDIERARRNREAKQAMETKPLRSNYFYMPGDVPLSSFGPAFDIINRSIREAMSRLASPLWESDGQPIIYGADGRPIRKDEP